MKTVKEIREAKGSFLGKVVKAVGSTAATPVTAPIKVAKAVGKGGSSVAQKAKSTFDKVTKYKEKDGERTAYRFSKRAKLRKQGEKDAEFNRQTAKDDEAKSEIEKATKRRKADATKAARSARMKALQAKKAREKQQNKIAQDKIDNMK